MYQYKKSNLPRKTYQIIVTIPRADIKKENKKSFDSLSKNLNIQGFRKGKAPQNIAKKYIKKEAINQQTMKNILPKLYDEIIKKEDIKPIVSPKIEAIKIDDDHDWELKITIAEKPEIVLGKYKEEIKKIKDNLKKEDIWVPGKDDKKTAKEDNEKKKQKLLNDILDRLLKTTKIEISDLIIEEELSKKLTQLVDDTQKVGLTMDSYLKSKNLTHDQIKSKYKQEIENTYKLEFLLMEIGDKENITVEKEDLDKIFSNISDPNELKKAQTNSYFYATLIRKQKILDSLLSL